MMGSQDPNLTRFLLFQLCSPIVSEFEVVSRTFFRFKMGHEISLISFLFTFMVIFHGQMYDMYDVCYLGVT